MAFIEHEFAGDPTNWWAPNHAGVEAMLRSSGLRVMRGPATRSICASLLRTPPIPCAIRGPTHSVRIASRPGTADGSVDDRSDRVLERAEQSLALGLPIDPEWANFRGWSAFAAAERRELAPEIAECFGGICPIDPAFLRR